MKNSLSIIIPCYNEEKNLENTFIQVHDALKQCGMNFDIIIIDDASRDRTAEIAEGLRRRFSCVRLFRHKKNQGIGGAFGTGLQYAQSDYVLLLPADNPLNAEDLEPYVTRIGQFNIVVGERTSRRGYRPLFQCLSFIYNRILIRTMFKLPLHDVNWITMYQRKIFKENTITIESQGIFFFAEILVKAHRKGLTIARVPARMKKRIYGKPTIYQFPAIWKTFWDLVRFSILRP